MPDEKFVEKFSLDYLRKCLLGISGQKRFANEFSAENLIICVLGCFPVSGEKFC